MLTFNRDARTGGGGGFRKCPLAFKLAFCQEEADGKQKVPFSFQRGIFSDSL